MLIKLFSGALVGLDARLVEVEVRIEPAQEDHFVVVGLPDTAVRESKDRVMAALQHLQGPRPPVKAMVNLAPGDVRKEGPLYDLPIALGLLGIDRFSDYLIVGELGLGGSVRPIRGALSYALLAKERGLKGVVVPYDNAQTAAGVEGIEVVAVQNLRELLEEREDLLYNRKSVSSPPTTSLDFSEVIGQSHVKRALEIAAAGNHNLLMMGPPGSGKTMLARALAGILPPLTSSESVEVTKIYSIAKNVGELITEAPFRKPHHTLSYAGMVGGGNPPRPGEISLAHRGVLFLDELPEYSRAVLEALRQPLEDGEIVISRAKAAFCFPTNFLLVAAMNPCPCGFLGHSTIPCRDSALQVARYQGRISGPLLDRIDLSVDVPQVGYHQVRGGKRGESSEKVRSRVIAVRVVQRERQGKVNGDLFAKDLEILAPLCREGHTIMQQFVEERALSMRGVHKTLRVARTIADLAGEASISVEHLLEALSYRPQREAA